MAARRLFGSFRKGEANDPETYVAAVLTILMDYPDEIVNEVCHPSRGLPATCDFLPTMKELKTACEAQATRVARLATYAALPAPARRLPAPPRPPEPTIFTAQGYPRYDALKRRYEAGEGPARFDNHVCVDNVTRYGIWTPYSWIVAQEEGVKGFTQFSEAELRAMYPPREPAPAEPTLDLWE